MSRLLERQRRGLRNVARAGMFAAALMGSGTPVVAESPDNTRAASQEQARQSHRLDARSVWLIEEVGVGLTFNSDHPRDRRFKTQFVNDVEGREATKYFDVREDSSGAGFFTDTFQADYFPQGVKTAEKDDLISPLRVKVQSPNDAGRDHTSITVRIVLGEDRTIQGFVADSNPDLLQQHDRFSVPELKTSLNQYFDAPTSMGGKHVSTTVLSEDGHNRVKRVYTYGGSRYTQIADGNGVLRYTIDFPKAKKR